MPFNGSGTFARLYSWVTDAANSVNISSSRTDAEMNGFAAGLTNCVTRDGQSPPSADIPWGGKKLTNLGAATVGTDALSQSAGDARYLQSASPSVTGNLTLATNNAAFQFTDLSGTHPYVDCQSDNTWGWYATDNTGAARLVFFILCRSAAAVPISFNTLAGGVTPTVGDNSTKLATTAFIVTALGSYAPLASPTLTGVPVAPTASPGTNTTQLATTAFVQAAVTSATDPLKDVPSNAKAANYALALTDRGGGVDFNGTSLTCTIPANASIAFPVGAVIVITNLNASALSIAITTDTLTLAGSTSTGTRTLAQNGMATIRKVGSTSWLISGAGLT